MFMVENRFTPEGAINRLSRPIKIVEGAVSKPQESIKLNGQEPLGEVLKRHDIDGTSPKGKLLTQLHDIFVAPSNQKTEPAKIGS